MKITELTSWLETIAPPMYQEDYDNAGLIVGNPEASVTGILCCLDSTEAVVQEAIEKGCNLIVAHHPIVFKGLKRLTGRTYVERVLLLAIKNDVAIYAIHTNLDNVYHQGVNAKICEKLGLESTRVLSPKKVLRRMSVVLPREQEKIIRNLLLHNELQEICETELINHNAEGSELTTRLEAMVPAGLEHKIRALLHRHDLMPEFNTTDSPSATVGSGMIGELPQPMTEADFLQYLKTTMRSACVRHTARTGNMVRTVAVCGGAGSFLLPTALAQQADVFVTADYKYHEFFDADNKILIADIGHFESEQFTIELLYEIISEKFPNFARYCTNVSTNPVHYL